MISLLAKSACACMTEESTYLITFLYSNFNVSILNLRICALCFWPHGSPRNTPTPTALTSGCSVRTFVSQPVLCCQQWQEGVGLIQFYSTSCYSTLNTEPGKCLCWRYGRRRSRVIGSRPSQHTKHKCGDRARAKESEWGGAWLSFLSQGYNSLPCKHWGKAVYQYTDCSA